MPARTSARSSANASSPPKRQSQSPVGTRTRSLRSQSVQSVDLGNATNSKRGGKRGARATSVESVKSNSSVGSNRRTRNNTRSAAAAGDLSIVQEDPESSPEPEEEIEDIILENDGDDEDEGDDEDKTSRNTSQDRMRSPGGMSQLSGTTAITSISIVEAREMDPMIAELLPELLTGAYKILDLLAPADASQIMVDAIVKDLKVFGSHRAKRLKYYEEQFGVTRENFGVHNFYVSTNVVNRKLLGATYPEEGAVRPDPIIHAANLATLIKGVLVNERESKEMQAVLTVLDTNFPEPFLTTFDDNTPEFGSSSMRRETFDMALEIRTMHIIATIFHLKDSEGWDPDILLVESFFETPLAQRNPHSSYVKDAIETGRVKDILRGGPPNTKDEDEQIFARVETIQNSFRYGDDAIEVGDLVDFERLEERFPWSTFLTNLVQWSRSRLTEIGRSIQQQGGIDTITQSLGETAQNRNSQIEINDQPPPAPMEPRQLLPPANIESTTSQSLYSKDAVRKLHLLKRPKASIGLAPSNQRVETVASSSRQTQPVLSRNQLQNTSNTGAQNTEPDNWQPEIGDRDDKVQHPESSRPTAEYVGHWDQLIHYKNKENRRPANDEVNPAKRIRLLDRQENAEKIQWSDDDDSRENVPRPSNRKRSREVIEDEDEDDEEVSEDGGFQDDQRIPDPKRRAAAPPARSRTPAQPSPRRAWVQQSPSPVPDDQSDRERAERALQASARDLDDISESPAPTTAEVKAAAKTAGVRVRLAAGETQKRVPWSEADEQLLVDLIEKYGCSWALIASQPGWEHDRPNFQVQCKDKARNMKVSYLKAEIELPVNFEHVALGQKEIRAVRKVIPEYEP